MCLTSFCLKHWKLAIFKTKMVETEDKNRVREFYCYLATERAEAEGIKKASATYLTSVRNTFSDSRLRSFIEEHDLCAVDDICLNARDVYVLLYLIHSHHVVVRRSPYLQFNFIFVNIIK